MLRPLQLGALAGLLGLACAADQRPAPVAPPAQHHASRAAAPPAKEAHAKATPIAAVPAPAETAAAPATPAGLTPLSDELRAALAAIRPDPPPRAITRGKHYVVSDEDEHSLYRQALAERGGIEIAVGAEQTWLIAGWSRPEIVIAMDFDEWIAELNWIYGVVFLHASTPDEFVSLWAASHADEVRGWIRERWPEAKEHEKKLRVFDYSRQQVQTRLAKLRRMHANRKTQSFLEDQDQYSHLVELWRTGRVLAIRGNLVDKTTMADIATFSQRAQIPVRVLYLSNAEGYFDYATGSYKANILGLPFDDKSIVLHTKPYDGTHYRYIYEPGKTFQAWLESGKVGRLCELFDFASEVSSPDDLPDLRTIAVTPTDAPPPPKRRCRKF